MDWLQFIATVVGHLAWPLVILVLLIMLRSHIGALAQRLEKFSLGGASISFKDILSKNAELIKEDAIQQAREIPPVQEALPLPLPKPPTSPRELAEVAPPRLDERPEEPLADKPRPLGRSYAKDHLGSFYELSPRGSILRAFEDINRVVRSLAEAYGMADMIDNVSESLLLTALLRQGVVSAEVFSVYDSLRKARDLIVHGDDTPSVEEVSEYVRQAEYVKSQLFEILILRKE